MKYKYFTTLLFAGFFAVITGQSAGAAAPVLAPSQTMVGSLAQFGSGDLDCSVLPDEICKAATQQPNSSSGSLDDTGIYKLLLFALNLMTALVGIAAVGALIYAGVLYSSAGGSKEQTAKSKKLITDTVIGLLAYALMFFVLNWLIPGGVIG